MIHVEAEQKRKDGDRWDRVEGRINLNVTKTAAVVIDSGPQNTVRFGAGPLRFGSQVVARRIDVFGPFRAVMAGRIGTWVARDCHIRVKSFLQSRARDDIGRYDVPPILSSTSVESPIIRKGRSDVKQRFTEAQIMGFGEQWNGKYG